MAKRVVGSRRSPRVHRSGELEHRVEGELSLAVSRLQPEELHGLILQRGLEQSAELLSLATPAQIAGVFDLDLWRPQHAGGDERFDATRFGEWLEVLVDAGAASAAAILAAQDVALVTSALARHVRIFDRGVVEPYVTLEGELTPTGYATGGQLSCDVGGYAVGSRRTDAWEPIVAVLAALETGHPEFFSSVMRGCTRLSDAGREIDGLDALPDSADQAMFDLAADRDARRHEQGYVAPAEARAFLLLARRPAAVSDRGPQERGLVRSAPGTDGFTDANAALAFLANTLVAGASVQGRALAPAEAPAAVAALCSLGAARAPANHLLAAFRAGWTRLHEEVCMYAADRLLSALTSLRRHDDVTDAALRRLRADLRRHLRAGTPWGARARFDIIASLDVPSWAALGGLIDELPVLPAVVRACLDASPRPVSASAFEFIVDDAQIDLIHAFADSLGERLTE